MTDRADNGGGVMQTPLSLADYLLSHLAQECAEVVIRATKAQHFGLDEVQPEQLHTNAERILHEWCDLLATMETLQEYGILPELPRGELHSTQEGQTRQSSTV